MTATEEKLMRAIARDLVGPFWDPTHADMALAKIKEHFATGECPPDGVAAGLSVGDRWGAYWLHADGMMRLYPPATKTGKVELMVGTGAWYEAWAEADSNMAERFCFRDRHAVSQPDCLRIASLMRDHREKYAQELLRRPAQP